MTQFEDIPKLPTAGAYIHGIVHLVSEQCLNDGDAIVQKTQERERRDFVFRSYLGRIADISHQVEVLNTPDTAAPDPDHTIKRVFNTGAVFGTFLAEHVHKGAISYHDIFSALPTLMVSDSPSGEENRRRAAIPYMEKGIIGSSQFLDERAVYLLEPLEKHLISDTTKRDFFRTGLGLILLSADDAHRAKLGEKPGTIDWNGALSELLDNDN